MVRLLSALLAALLWLVAPAYAQSPPTWCPYTSLVFGPNLVLGKTANPSTSYPTFSPGVNVVPFTFFGTGWTSIGATQNSDGSISLDGTGEGYGNGLSTATVGQSKASPLTLTGGQSFGGGFCAQVSMKGNGPMSWWANDIEEMNGGSEGWGNTPWPNQPQYTTVQGSVTNGDTISVLAYAPWLNGGNIISLTFSASGSVSTVASSVASVINGNSMLTSAGVSAATSGALITYTETGGQEPGVRFLISVVGGSYTEQFHGDPNNSNSSSVQTYGTWLEPDIAEFDSTNEYSWAFHNWNGALNSNDIPAVYGGPLSSCPGGGPSCTWVGPTLNGVTVDFTQYHTYGMLWIPATNSVPGYVQYYLDGNAVSNQFFYNIYNAANGPPPLVNSPTNCVASVYVNDHNAQVCQILANTAWSIVDRRHLAFIFGGATGSTVTYNSMEIWQNASGMAADIPPIASSGTTQFSVANGQIIRPNGKVFVPTGVNLYLEQASNIVAQAGATPLTTLFPGINYVRLVIETGTPFQNYPTPASMASFINLMTNAGIVVDIDDHSCNGGDLEESSGAVPGPPYCSPPTGSALTTVTNWYTAMAQYYASNPYVWFASVNEPCTDAATCSFSNGGLLSTYQAAIYNAVRVAGASNNMMIMLAGIGGGDCGSVGTAGTFTPSTYATMTNIIWELHAYPGQTTEAAVLAALTGSQSTACGFVAAQTIHSKDGVVPVVFGEWGTASGESSGADAGPAISAMESVASSNSIGNAAFTVYGYAPTWQMVTPPPTGPGSYGLTGWGTDIAAEIANVSQISGGGKTAVPAPLTGTVTPQNWTVYDQNFNGITLACGKPFHFIVLPPAQYNPTIYKYPLLIWLHPDFQGDPWYLGTNTSPAYLANDETANFNTVNQLTNYPAFVASPYADQTNGNGSSGSCTGDGNDAVENWGGWNNNGLTGSGTVYSGDTGPNVFAVLDMINYLEGVYSIDPSRIFVEGFSLGGIGAEYLAQKYNTQTGSPSVFASAASMAGVLQINGFAAGPTGAQETAMTSVPVWWFGGTGDTQSVQSQWNEPMFTALSGGSSAYPPAITSVAANRAGSSAMEYTLCPTCGHQDTDASGNPVWVNTTIMNWMFGATGGGCTTNCGGGGGPVTSTSWDPTRLPASMALSNSNQTASVTSTPSGSTGVVWSTSSYSSGKYCFGVVMTTASTNWAVGLANTSFPAVPTSLAGLGGDGYSQGFYPVTPPQSVYYNGVALSTGSSADVSGDEVDECVDLGADLAWVSTPVMRAASETWNNSAAQPATWNPADKDADITLSSGNTIATTNGTGVTGVRDTASHTTGKYYGEFTSQSTMSSFYGLGLATSAWNFNAVDGLGGDTVSVAWAINGTVYINNNSIGTAEAATASGTVISMAVDLDAKLIWFRVNGGNWNNSGSANPATGAGGFALTGLSAGAFFSAFGDTGVVGDGVLWTGSAPFAESVPSGFSAWGGSPSADPATGAGGVSISGLVCPCYIAFQSEETSSVATLNAGGPLAIGALPSGFSIWAPPAANTNQSPKFINLGSNDNHPRPANDDGRLMWYLPVNYRK